MVHRALRLDVFDRTKALGRVAAGALFRPGLLKRLRRVLIVSVLAVAAYEAMLNAFLISGGLGRLISRDPDKILVQYSYGWSILPGRVHARGLRVRSKDGNVEFDLRIERCTFDVALSELLRRKFHVLRVRGNGITFVARTRIDPHEATRRRLAAIPHIEGLEGVPLRGPPTPPPDDAHYRLFTFALDDVDAEAVHEIWMDALRFDGNMHVVGSFFLRPIRWARVGPVTATVRSGRVTVGEDEVAREVRGQVETTVDGFDPRVVHGGDVLHRTSVQAQLSARISGRTFLRSQLSRRVGLQDGTAELDIDARMVHGRIASPSRATARVVAAELEVPPVSIAGNASASMVVARSGSADSLVAKIALQRLRVASRGFEPVPIQIERFELQASSSELDLVDHPMSDLVVSMHLPAARVQDARFVDAWLDRSGAPLRVQAGHGTVEGDLQVERSTGRGRAILALQDLEIDLGKREKITGQLQADVELRRWDITGGHLDLSGTHIEVRSVAATDGTANWWANVDTPSSRLDVAGAAEYQGRLDAYARDVRPFFSGLLNSKGLPGWIAGLASTSDLRASARLEVNPASQAIDVRDLDATAGPFRVQGILTKRGDESHWVARVTCGPLVVGIESLGHDTHVQLFDTDRWYQEQTLTAAPRTSPFSRRGAPAPSPP